jgi:phosphatidate cytidylyltransferase
MPTPEQPAPEEPLEPEPEGLLDVRSPVPYDATLDDVAAIPPAEVIESKPSRAGRNLKAAFGVGGTLGALVLGTLLTNKVSFLVLVMVAIAVGVWEMRSALRHAGVSAPLVPPVVGSVAMLWAAYVHGPLGLTVAWTLTAAAVVLWRGAGPVQGAARDVLGGIFVATYPALLAGFAILLLAGDDGVERVLVFVIVTVASDTGGYAAGVLLGKHPLAPTISPKKSWEGFGGSVLLCVVAGALTLHFLLGHAWWIGVLLGVGVAFSATVGDLLESLIKRDLGIKDMSNLLPGHGGVMDRLDSLIVVAPMVWAVLTLLAPAAS